MSICGKLLMVFIACGVVPMLAVNITGRLSGVRAQERLLHDDLESSADQIAGSFERKREALGQKLLKLAHSDSLRDYARTASGGAVVFRDELESGNEWRASRSDAAASASNSNQASDLPDELRADVKAFLVDNRDYFRSLTFVTAQGRRMFRAKPLVSIGGIDVEFQTKNLGSEESPFGETWRSMSPKLSSEELSGGVLQTTVPISDTPNARPRAAFIVEDDLEHLFKETGRIYGTHHSATMPYGASAGATERHILFLNRAGDRILHYTVGSLSNSEVNEKTPFKSLAQKAAAQGHASGFYEEKDGVRWIVSFQKIADGNSIVGVSRNYTAAMAGIKRTAWRSIIISLLVALAASAMLWWVARSVTQRIKLVTDCATAIAAGNLNQRIELHAKDETQALAESFNRMSDRLREQITREAESKQFESFMRLSAMLTHDLKNAIAGLSMLVGNMERQFHREEFRADAILSLREATDKLRRLVARLSEPVKSLSGEYRRNIKKTDLVPIIKRVLAATAEPSAPLYEIKTQLPESLVAMVEAERIENVIENLIINAMEAMGACGGRLTIEAGWEGADRIFFSIADTGIGMSEDFISQRLFRPFATTKTKGIGLGLYTCREIVEAHGGRLEVKSKQGVGTRFRVVLPSEPFTISSRSNRTN